MRVATTDKALQTLNPLLAFDLPGVGRLEFVPGGKQVLRLARDVPNTDELLADDGNRLSIANAARPRLRTLLVGTLDQAQDLEIFPLTSRSPRRLPLE